MMLGPGPRLAAALSLLGPLAACTAIPPASGPATPPLSVPGPVQIPPQAPPAPPSEGFRTPRLQQVPGLEWLYRQDARGLAGALGNPRLDLVEGDMRKQQFANSACVLDVFLYPLGPGAEPVATHVEARRASDGQEVDRRACAEALRRR